MGEDRKFPIAFIGEEFDYCLRYGAPIPRDGVTTISVIRGDTDLVRATVLAVSTNHFTGEYVYKIRNDHFRGSVDENWYTESQVWKMKGDGCDG